jgi:hypothetical protein
MSVIKKPSRRDFMKTTGATFGVPYVITSAALGNSERPAASDRIVMGGIGIGNMDAKRHGAPTGSRIANDAVLDDGDTEFALQSQRVGANHLTSGIEVLYCEYLRCGGETAEPRPCSRHRRA